MISMWYVRLLCHLGRSKLSWTEVEYPKFCSLLSDRLKQTTSRCEHTHMPFPKESIWSPRSFQLVGDGNLLAMKLLGEVSPFTLNIRWVTETILAIFAGSIPIALLMWRRIVPLRLRCISVSVFTEFLKQHMSIKDDRTHFFELHFPSPNSKDSTERDIQHLDPGSNVTSCWLIRLMQADDLQLLVPFRDFAPVLT